MPQKRKGFGARREKESGARAEEALREEALLEEPLYDETPLPALTWRRRWRKYRWLLWLLVMVPIVYLAVQVFIILAPRMRTEVVMLDTMTDSLPVKGQVVFSSVPVNGGGGPLFYTVPTGQRVAPGAEVALVMESEAAVNAMDRLAAVDAELELLREAQRTAVDGGDMEVLLGQMQAGLYNLLGGMEAGEYAALSGARNEITLASNKMQISTGEAEGFQARVDYLIALRAECEAQAKALSAVAAPEGGYFAPSPKLDRIQMSYERAAEMTPPEMLEALQADPGTYGGEVVGHIITDYKWYFYTVVESRLAARFVEGDKSLSLSFPSAGDASVAMTVGKVQADDESGLALVELYSEYLSPDILTLRLEDANIVFGERKGIRIDKDALRLMDVDNGDGSVSTYRGVYVQFGNMVYFRRIEILVEDEFYMLVPEDYAAGVNEVRLYDTVVVDPGGVELYDRKIL